MIFVKRKKNWNYYYCINLIPILLSREKNYSCDNCKEEESISRIGTKGIWLRKKEIRQFHTFLELEEMKQKISSA